MSKNEKMPNGESNLIEFKKSTVKTNEKHVEPLVDLIQHLHDASQEFSLQETDNHRETAKGLQTQTEVLALALREFTDTLLWEAKNPIKDRMIPVYVDINELGNEEFISNRYVVQNTKDIIKLPFSSNYKQYMTKCLVKHQKGIFVDQLGGVYPIQCNNQIIVN